MDYLLSHKTCHNKFKKIEIISGIFCNHSRMNFKINSIRETEKFTSMWKLSTMLLNSKWVKEETKEKLEIALRLMKIKIQHTTTYGMWKKQ